MGECESPAFSCFPHSASFDCAADVMVGPGNSVNLGGNSGEFLVIGIWAVAARFFRAIKRGMADPAFRGLFYLTSIIVGSGTLFYRFAEDWSWLDSLYFTVITLTTVGYGDFSPTKAASKVFTIVLILIGIGLLVALIQQIAHYAVEDHAERRQQN